MTHFLLLNLSLRSNFAHKVLSISTIFRNLHVTRVIQNAYEGPGKTTISFISKEIGSRLLVTHCNEVFICQYIWGSKITLTSD